MGFLGRFFGRTPAPPDWARDFSGAEYAEFISMVKADFVQRNWPFELHDDGSVRLAQGSLSLANLAATCRHQMPRTDWEAGIKTFFDRLAGMSPADAVPEDFGQARPHLRLRLYEETAAKQLGGVDYPIADGIRAVLMVDTPQMVLAVKRETVQQWAVDGSELFEIARQNLRMEGQSNRDLVHAKPPISALVGESVFAATRTVLLDLEGTSRFGTLVGIPNRHVVLCHAIEDDQLLAATAVLARMTMRGFSEGPYSISPHVYWCDGKGVMRMPFRQVDGGDLQFDPPEVFVERVLRPIGGH